MQEWKGLCQKIDTAPSFTGNEKSGLPTAFGGPTWTTLS